ncbi:tyrosine-type recombinase/integrase [Halolamina sp. C58]|uniref:tyrosine-type recombinase/integrase n=1 Tax=Halolamina sp. C58 TaxID=3421640 RepID=UPI003EBD8A6E
MDFERILTEFKKRRTSDIGESTEATADTYITHVRTWKSWLAEERNKTLWEAETTDLRLFVEDLIFDGKAPSTVSQRVSAISIFYQDCNRIEDRYDGMPDVPTNPYDGFNDQDRKMLNGDSKKQKSLEKSDGDKYPYIGHKEIEKLINNVPAPRLRNELIIRLLFDCGFRRGELANAKVEHVNEDDTIRIPPRKSEGRIVGFREDTSLLLDRWLNRGGRESMTYAPDSDFLFPTNYGEHISGNYLNRMVKKAAENAGIQETAAIYSNGREQHKITAHTLRHSFAMDKLKKVDVVTLQKLMGHSELDTTMIYVNMSDEEAKEKSKRFTDF